MPFVTEQEFANYLRTSFDEEDAATAAQLLADAQGTIEDEVGQRLEQSTDTVTLDGSGTEELLLPRWPVTAVTSVTVTEASGTVKVLSTPADYSWSQSGVLTRKGGCWPDGDRSVDVVYTPGYAQLPTNVKRICRRLAASAWHNPAGADSEDTGDHRVRWAAPGGELTTGEKRMLDPYRVR